MYAANACSRFRECSKHLKFKVRSVTIQETYCQSYSERDVVSERTARLLLNTFGEFIQSIDWRLKGSNRKHELFNLLAKSCGKTLKELKINYFNPSFSNENQFLALEQLIFYNAEPRPFCFDSPIKYLEYQDFRLDEPELEEQPWFVREFPHLESVRFNTTKITDETLIEFLSFNRQLRALQVESAHLTPLVFEGIAFHASNMERLEIKSHIFYEYELDFVLFHLGELRNLSELRMSGRVPLELLLKMFAKNDAPIRSIKLDIAATDGSTSLPTINTLTKIQCMCRTDVDQSVLVSLAKSQPALQILQILFMDSQVTVSVVENILRFGKSLTNVDIFHCLPAFDLNKYNRIFKLAGNRVKVRIGPTL